MTTEPNADLLAEVAAAREQFRTERDRQRADLAKRQAAAHARAKRLKTVRKELTTDRAKVRALLKRFLRRMKAKWRAERLAVAGERAGVAADAAALGRQRDEFAAERERQTAQLGEYKRRLYEAWELLADNQQRLLADRQQAEAWTAQQTTTAERRLKEALDREQRLNDTLTGQEARRNAAAAEIAGLEVRAANLREVVRKLDGQRAAGGGPAGGVVPLDAPAFHPAHAAEADEVLAGLHETAQAVTREKAKLAGAHAVLDRRATAVADDRLVLAEQVATLTAVRERWQQDERRLLADLEDLARQVRARELEADERERAAARTEADRREREAGLADLRARLEGWQAALSAYEAAAGGERGRQEAELTERRRELERRAAALEAVRGVWMAMRDGERANLHAELYAVEDERAKVAAAHAAADAGRREHLAAAERFAAAELARAEADEDGRRVRVLRKRWERRFERLRKEAEGEGERAAAERQRADDRVRELHAAVVEATTRQAAASDAQAAADRRRITDEVSAVPAVLVDDSPTEGYLHHLRAEIERLSGLVSTDAEPDVIPLRLSAAA